MKIRKAYKFKLKPKSGQEHSLARFAGCNRFAWNRALAIIKESLDKKEGYLNYNAIAKRLTSWKKEVEFSFFKEVHSQPLQQTLKDLDRACKDGFKKDKGFPKFKKRGVHDSFKYPQGIKITGSLVFIPKIGWVKFQKSREIKGTIKNTTVSKRCGYWYVSFQVELEQEVVFHPSKSVVGIDLGVAKFATLSDQTIYSPVNSFKSLRTKLAKHQRKLARKKKFSENWKKQKSKITRIHSKIADVRKDWLHKISTEISKNHAMISVENLKIKNMSKSAKGSTKEHGKNVKAKSGLNRSILDQSWFEFVRQLEYKQLWKGGDLIKVDPKYTSQKCNKCNHTAKENRKTQSKFKCIECGHSENADINAAKNILEAGLSSLACRDIKKIAS
ncbi:transposase [Candidatus Pacearchaeota archaeon]|nr:transposase [Candidatus Pacearchaeota archaeon]